MKLNDVTTLEFLNFNTSSPGNYRIHCEKAYLLWKAEWTETFKELGTSKELCADDFYNREIGGLFLGNEPIGFILYQFENFQTGFTTDLAYFGNYEDELLIRHKNFNDKVLIATYFTTHKDWRKKQTNYSISELIVSFMNLRLIYSDANRMIGYFRNNRKTNEIFYRHGGRFIYHHSAYNVDVDFSEAFANTVHLSDWLEYSALASKLWLNFLKKQRGEKHELTRSLKQQIHESTGARFQRPRLEQ